MHNHSKHNCRILKGGVNDPGLAFAGKVGLGPFWTGVQVLSYVHAQQLLVSTFASSFRHERTSIGGKIYTKMQMQDLFDGLYFNHSQPDVTIKGVLVGHIHLDKNTFSILFHKGTICNSLLIILFDGDCVHIYVNKLI
jgi:hypothetical protein